MKLLKNLLKLSLTSHIEKSMTIKESFDTRKKQYYSSTEYVLTEMRILQSFHYNFVHETIEL